MSEGTKKTCSVPGCGRRHSSNGFCAAHAIRAKHGRNMNTPIHKRIGRYGRGSLCAAPDCYEMAIRNGYCSRHSQRMRKNGTLEISCCQRPKDCSREWWAWALKAMGSARSEIIRTSMHPWKKWAKTKVGVHNRKKRNRRIQQQDSRELLNDWESSIRRMTGAAKSSIERSRRFEWNRWCYRRHVRACEQDNSVRTDGVAGEAI